MQKFNISFLINAFYWKMKHTFAHGICGIPSLFIEKFKTIELQNQSIQNMTNIYKNKTRKIN